jgi:hypothetical protein
MIALGIAPGDENVAILRLIWYPDRNAYAIAGGEYRGIYHEPKVPFQPIMRISTAVRKPNHESHRFAFLPGDWISFILLIYGTVKY